MMAMNPYLAKRLMKERVKDALREAEQARLARIAQNSHGTRRSYFQRCNTSASGRVAETTASGR